MFSFSKTLYGRGIAADAYQLPFDSVYHEVTPELTNRLVMEGRYEERAVGQAAAHIPQTPAERHALMQFRGMSRQHFLIYSHPSEASFSLVALGKNPVHVNGKVAVANTLTPLPCMSFIEVLTLTSFLFLVEIFSPHFV